MAPTPDKDRPPGLIIPEHTALLMHLECCVPLRISELRGVPPDRIDALGRAQEPAIAAHGDDLMYGGPHCREALNAVVTGLATLAYCPGGVTFAGVHWHATHTDSPQFGVSVRAEGPIPDACPLCRQQLAASKGAANV